MRKIAIIICIVLFCFGSLACTRTLSTEKRGNDSVTRVSSEDVEMNKIIDRARKSVNKFLLEMNNPNTKGKEFSVKYPFKTDPGSKTEKEHIWLDSIETKDNKYYGIVANETFYINSMKIGDKVEFDINMISDWKYIEDGFLVGGESIIYFYDRMTPKEKMGFEKEAGFKIRTK